MSVAKKEPQSRKSFESLQNEVNSYLEEKKRILKPSKPGKKFISLGYFTLIILIMVRNLKIISNIEDSIRVCD